MLVQKFGGTSVADPERIRAVADHVARTRRASDDVVVVVSAMGKSTDDLMRLAFDVADQPHGRELDMLLTAGERISIALVCMAVENLGVPAMSFTGSQAGIVTDTAHNRGIEAGDWVLLAAIAAIGFDVAHMLGTVEFDGQAGVVAEEVDFHLAMAVKRQGKFRVKSEAAGGCRQGLEPPIEKSLRGAAATDGAVGIVREGVGGVRKQIRERRVDAVTD